MFGQNDDAATLASQQAIEAGGIPPSAQARLQENAARQGTPAHMFSSNFSANEFLLTRECGFEPLGQVMGTSVMHVGWQYLPSQSWTMASGELATLSAAYSEARIRAMKRLFQEASLLRADGVVGARILFSDNGLPEDMMEFQVIGTAVRRLGASGPSGGTPFVSNLSGQDHWALRQTGYKPIGFAFGNCSWYQLTSWGNQSINSVWSGNQEFPDFTQGIYNSREIAMDRLQASAMQIGGKGVVGVQIMPNIRIVERPQQNTAVQDLIAQFVIYGTVIAPEAGAGSDMRITTTVGLNGVL